MILMIVRLIMISFFRLFNMIKILCKKIILTFLIFNLVFLVNLSWAKEVHIRVTEARDVGIKIVVLPFNNLAKYNQSKEISSIITNDLNYSGQFKVLELDLEDLETMEKTPIYLEKVDFKFWRETGAEYLLMTKLYPSSDAQKLIVNLQLLDLYKPLDPINLNTEIAKYPNESPRKLAHRISDIIFSKLTGIKSFFNTKISYIRAERLGEQNPEYSLNIADFDGSNERRLLEVPYPLMSPSWSPDGTKISFVSFKGNRSSINIANLTTGKINVVTRYQGINGAPAWSPYGDKLAVVLSKEGSPKIYILDIATGHLQKVTQGMAIDTEPCWSRDGQEIFFTSNRGGKPQIYKATLSDGQINRVTFNGEYNATPTLTPDNRHLVMLHCKENCSKTETGFNIAVQSLDSGKVRVLTKIGMEDSPVVSPNGTMVLYSARPNKNSDRVLAGVSIDGHFNKYLFVAGNGSLKNPAWSPFLE